MEALCHYAEASCIIWGYLCRVPLPPHHIILSEIFVEMSMAKDIFNVISFGPVSDDPCEDKIAPELWQEVKEKVRGQIAKGNYETWIKDTRGLRFSDNTLVVGAPSGFVQEHIERFLYSHLLKTTIEVLGRRVKLEFQAS